MIIYAMSDIHGQERAFEEALSLVDLGNPEAMLVLCGDYIDHGWEHPEWFDRIRHLQETHPGQVVVLKGNHEDLYRESYGGTLSRETRRWLRDLPLFYETEQQIFVHAGIEEDAGDLWRVACEDWFFHSKMPASFGPFFKDIIAGHVGTYRFCGENRVYWDGEAHFYLDGSTETSGVVPVLKYDSATNRYTTFTPETTSDGTTTWTEDIVHAGRPTEESF